VPEFSQRLKQMDAINVTAAIIQQNGKVLVARRKSGHLQGKWEFPGGKIEPGETPEACLERELLEEFEIKIETGNFVAESIFHYKAVDRTIRLLGYKAKYVSGSFRLHVHDEVAWVGLDELDSYDFAPADIPLAHEIQRMAKE
jgi:8-oxo-dGTP diphosphatase